MDPPPRWLRIQVVNAFAPTPYGGNPAGVCLLDEPLPDAALQAIAAQMALAETAFLWREGDAFRIRWFTPTVENDLCGHATLASAHALWERGHAPRDAPIRFHSRSGPLGARLEGDDVVLDFPEEAPRPVPREDEVEAAIGVRPLRVAQNRFDVIAELPSESHVRKLAPDLARIAALDARSLAVTARASTPGHDFVSRLFAPQWGIPEDPVTGSLHCGLAPFWAPVLGKTDFRAWQASARGGELGVRLRSPRVLLSGRAWTVLEGRILRPGGREETG